MSEFWRVHPNILFAVTIIGFGILISTLIAAVWNWLEHLKKKGK